MNSKHIFKANIAHASRLGVLPDMLQVSEPNLVYATTAAAVASNPPYIAVAEESPRYIVVNNDNSNSSHFLFGLIF